jgi:hypothetical protein
MENLLLIFTIVVVGVVIMIGSVIVNSASCKDVGMLCYCRLYVKIYSHSFHLPE